MDKGVTTKDIAKALNISRGTVSRALNNSDGVSEQTRQMVLRMAKQMGFKPNRAARSLVMNKKYKIGVVVFSEPKYFWDEVKRGVVRAEEELRDYGLITDYVVTDIRNPQQQIDAIRKLIDDGAQAIAISPNEPELMMDVIDELHMKGIPSVTVSSDIPASQRLCYVGCDYIRAGRIAAQVLGRMMNCRGKVAVLTFTGNVISIHQKITGFREAISEFREIEVIGPYKLSRTGEGVYDFICGLLEQYPDLNGIYVGYGVLEQVGQAVKDLGCQDKISIIGYDLSPSIANLIREGVIDAVICQEPFNQGYYPIKILHHYLSEGKKPARSIVNTKLEVVLKENLMYYDEESDYYNFLYNI